MLDLYKPNKLKIYNIDHLKEALGGIIHYLEVDAEGDIEDRYADEDYIQETIDLIKEIDSTFLGADAQVDKLRNRLNTLRG